MVIYPEALSPVLVVQPLVLRLQTAPSTHYALIHTIFAPCRAVVGLLRVGYYLKLEHSSVTGTRSFWHCYWK